MADIEDILEVHLTSLGIPNIPHILPTSGWLSALQLHLLLGMPSKGDRKISKPVLNSRREGGTKAGL